MKTAKLSDLKAGESALIQSVEIKDLSVANRLADLGFVENAAVACYQKSPFGGVTSFELEQGVFAIDSDLSSQILVQRSPEPC